MEGSKERLRVSVHVELSVYGENHRTCSLYDCFSFSLVTIGINLN